VAALTTKQRVEVNAALACLHHHNMNPGAVEVAAKAAIRSGASPAQAYQRAVNAATASRPDVAQRIARMGALVDASDDATVASYDVALRGYITTGNPAHLARVEKTAMRDAVELAIQNGEITREDASAGRANWGSIGLSAEGVAAAYSDAPTPPPVVSSSFSFQQGPAADPHGDAAGWSPTGGYSSARAKPEWQNGTVVTGTPSPYAGMNAGQMRAAMRGETPINESN